MKDTLQNRSFAFVVRVINLYKFLKDTKRGNIISRQLLRSGTAPGALIREAQKAKLISFINSRLLSRNVMKPFIGWNYLQ